MLKYIDILKKEGADMVNIGGVKIDSRLALGPMAQV